MVCSWILLTGLWRVFETAWCPEYVHYSDVIMSVMASLISSLTIVYSTVYSDADQRKHQNSASLAFVRGIHRSPVNSPHKWPVTQKMFPFDDVIMKSEILWHLRMIIYTGKADYYQNMMLHILEYWIEYISFELLSVMFTFPTRIFYRAVPGFATDCPCGVKCRGLTICHLYVDQRFGNLV